MNTIRNIKTREKLAQMVYEQYHGFVTTKEDKECLEMEVGAAFKGYTKAVENVAQIIVDGKEDAQILKDIRDFVVNELNGKTTKQLFRFTELPTTDMKDYINTTVKEELMNNGNTEEEAACMCNCFIDNPACRQNIINQHDLETIRICEHCGKPIHKGYVVNGCNTYCSEECAKNGRCDNGKRFH